MISPITWMKMIVATSDAELETVRPFLSVFRQIDIDSEVAEIAVGVRRTHKMRLPDAIIWASAQKENALLISRNIKDFPVDSPGIRIPFNL